MKKKVIAAMSGGVDSSVCAALLLEQGFEVVGVNLKLYDGDGGKCLKSTAADDAKAVCDKLGIEFVQLDRTAEFKKYVVDYFISSYFNGETPNPCVECNRSIKFSLLLSCADEIGADFVATGHYAKNVFEDGQYRLKKAEDTVKDQSYFLYTLTQDKLKRVLFPLGDFTKSEIKAISERLCLEVEKKRESQDICFVPDGDYAKFILENTNRVPEAGSFINKNGDILGTHKGIIHYTVGQRRGLGVSSTGRLYVIGRDEKTNSIILGDESDLYVKEFFVRDFSFTAEDIDFPFSAEVKTRYSAKATPCFTEKVNGMVRVVLDSPKRAVTKGQSAVFYKKNTVIGGGTIDFNKIK